MAKYTGPACKLCRREDNKLFLKGSRCFTDKCSMERRPYPPGQHGQRRSKISDYGVQLREKQKLKRIYGLHEKPMRNLFQKAVRSKGVTGDNMLSMLERRLDNVVYRIGFAASRAEARQLVRHNHFTVNGHKANIPSMVISKNDVVELKQKSRESEKFKSSIEQNLSYRELPSWIEVDKNNFRGIIRDLPKSADVTSAVEPRLVVELYSK